MSHLYISPKLAAAVLAEFDAEADSPDSYRAKFNEMLQAVRGVIASWAAGGCPTQRAVEQVMSDVRALRAADLRHSSVCMQLSDLIAENRYGHIVVEEEMATRLFPSVEGSLH